MSDLPLPYHGAITLKSLLENPDLLNPPNLTDDGKKEKKLDDGYVINRQSAHLGANLWDQTVSLNDIGGFGDDNFKFEFMDLDEFLMENESSLNPNELIPTDPELPVSPSSPNSSPILIGPSSPNVIVERVPSPLASHLQIPAPVMPVRVEQKSTAVCKPQVIVGSIKGPTPPSSPVQPNIDFNVNAQDVVLATIPEFIPRTEDIQLSTIPGEEEYDPRKRQFSEEELKPQPMIKKSKKIFVPEDLKDDKYWSRRRKNNVAAKRSRDARRIKENQIALRAAFLEKVNTTYKNELERMKLENKSLKSRLAKYES